MQIDRTKFEGKLLFWDIETSFIHVYTHYIGSKVSISHKQVVKDKRIICISYKAEGWKRAKTLYWDKYQDDTELLTRFTEIAKDYDILIGQNGDQFDLKTFKGRLWAAGLPPLTNVQTLDTLKMSRQNFKLTSHTLDYKAKLISDSGKIPTNIDLWKDVEQGSKRALKDMGKYCEMDVEKLQEVFWSMLPYVDKLPVNLSVLLTGSREGCPKCGHMDLIKNGTRPGASGLRQRWTCRQCGHDWTDSRCKSTTDRIYGSRSSKIGF